MWFVPYGLRNSCSKCCWKVLCVTHALFVLLLLGEFLFQCFVHSSRAVHPLLLGEFLGPILLESLVHAVFLLLLGECLVQYHWNVLCAVCALFIPYCFLGGFCFHFILGRLCFLCTPFFCYFSLGPSAPFPSKCLLCVSLALSLLVRLCCLPIQLGHLLSTSFVGMTYRNPYWSILFLVLQLLPFAFWTSLLGASSCTCLLYLRASFGSPLAWPPFVQLLFATFILGFFSRHH